MDIYRRWPWQQWDEVDRVFFETDEAQTDWAALKIVAQQPRYRTYPDSESFDFLFYAFRWAKSPDLQPRCFVHKVSGQLPDRYLEDMHDRAVLENWDAYWISHRLSVANVTDDEALVGSSSNGHTTVLKFSVNLVEDQNICTNPFWRVNFRWDFVKKGLFAAW
jgi:hypothetical protein